jgi:carboxyl-terminal processing protease
VIGVTWQGQPPIDILLYEIDELEHDLNAANKSEVTLTIKGINGQIKTVSLTKGKIELNENTIKSFLLKGTKSIGYISLPGFYTQFEDHSNKGCANDIARELIKLKKEKIDGLILDLRFNGGGSLYEALSLAGIFIDAGPVALMQETGQPVVTLKDLNRGTIYDGPLVIMVNGFSASASELVSAVLQDLNRAIIVGKQTYGKATGQVIMPIDKNSPERSGYLKVTNERIYRITGKSLQKKGVSPDIFMPDFLESITERERDFASALNADSVVKKSYYTPLPSLPIAELSVKSKTRIATAKSFASIQQAENIFSQSIPLQLKEFAQYNQALDTLMESLGKLTQQNLYQVQQNRFDNSLLSIDDHKREINEEVLKEIQHSVFIEEAYLILLDYLLLLQPNQK